MRGRLCMGRTTSGKCSLPYGHFTLLYLEQIFRGMSTHTVHSGKVRWKKERGWMGCSMGKVDDELWVQG